jgi:hypothetical protein
MKLNRFGVAGAFIAAAYAVGCSSDTPKSSQNGENTGSITFKLRTTDSKVDLTQVHYDLATNPALAPVLSDDIDVPRPESTMSLGLQRLVYGSYRLRFTAQGTYHGPTGDKTVSCTSEGDPNEIFSVSTPSATLPVITLTCPAVSGQTDARGGVEVGVDVHVVETTQENVVETFSYGPRAVLGYLSGGVCTFPVVNIKIKHDDTAVTYLWSDASDGTFLPNNATVDGTYSCGSGGTKLLTLTATKGATVSTKQFTIVCDDTPCGFACGNGIVEGSEQCDETSARCNASCQVTPSCGDGVVDGPAGVCFGGKTNAACTEACDPLTDSNCTTSCTIIPPVTCGNGAVEPGLGEDCEPPGTALCDAACHRIPSCGDGIIDVSTETCDDGATGPLPNNSNTLANACRTDCSVAHCGDNVVDTGEQCDPPASGTCSATCQTTVVTPPSQFETCTSCISGDPDTNDIQQFFCAGAGCQEVEACIVNSGCYFPSPTDCYCGLGVGSGSGLDACRQPSSTVPAGPCAALFRTATGNLLTGTGQIDNANTLDNSTLTDNVAGQAQAVVANLADPAAVCFGACGFP